MIRGMIQFVLFFVVNIENFNYFLSLDLRSALALFVTRITRTDDPDLAVTFDDLAEFTSALHRRSNFHFSTPKFYWFCLKKLVHPFRPAPFSA